MIRKLNIRGWDQERCSGRHDPQEEKSWVSAPGGGDSMHGSPTVTPVRKQKRPVWRQQQKEEWQAGRLGKMMRPR